jgi:isoleucyl-tRNA synthetase
VRLVVNLGHAVRARNNIKVRQPLSVIKVGIPGGFDSKLLEAYSAVILEELNIKQLEILTEATQIARQTVKPNAKLLGPKYGKDVQVIIGKAKEGAFVVLKNGDVQIGTYVLTEGEFEMGFESEAGLNVESEEGFVVGVDIEITETLRLEGLMRDLIRLIQDQRKHDNLHVADRIHVVVASESGDLQSVITSFAVYIQNETLADSLEVDTKTEVKSDLVWNDMPLSLDIKVN